MFTLHEFDRHESDTILTNLKGLAQSKVITGVNQFRHRTITRSELALLLSHLHRSDAYIDATLESIACMPVLRSYSQGITRESVTRKRNSFFYVGDNSWMVDKSGRTEYFDWVMFEPLDQMKLLDPKIRKFIDVPEYKGLQIGGKEKDGYEMFFDLPDGAVATALVDMFVARGRADADNPWPDADVVPCIVLGERVPELYHGENLGLFSPLHKCGIVRGNEEVSFYIGKKLPELNGRPEFRLLKDTFGDELEVTPGLGYTAFVNRYIDV